MSKGGKAKTAADTKRQTAERPTHETVMVVGPTGKRRFERRPVSR